MLVALLHLWCGLPLMDPRQTYCGVHHRAYLGLEFRLFHTVVTMTTNYMILPCMAEIENCLLTSPLNKFYDIIIAI